MGCGASLSGKYLPGSKGSEAGADASSDAPAPGLKPEGGASSSGDPGLDAEAPAAKRQRGPRADVAEAKKWSRDEMQQLSIPQLCRWLEALGTDVSPAIAKTKAMQRLWEEIQKHRPPALEGVTDPAHLDHWPLPEALRWLEYFEAADEKVVDKDRLVQLLLDHGEELPAPSFLGESAEDAFLTQVQRHVSMVKQAATELIAQLAQNTAQVEAQERARHSWHANGKAIAAFSREDLPGADQMDIPFTELRAGERVDLTIHEASGWAWAVSKGEASQGWVPVSTVVEVAKVVEEHGESDDADEGTMKSIQGEELEVVMRHYSGWSLCRRPGMGGGGDGDKPLAEGWIPDNCINDHPRNLATKQQHLIQSGLQRLAQDATTVETSFFKLRTQAADGEGNSLESLYQQVCTLVEEYRSICGIVQAKQMLVDPEKAKQAADDSSKDAAFDPAALGLPDWVRYGNGCYWVSKSQSKNLSVTIKKVCQERRQILVTFDSDANARKIVSFDAFADLGKCPLQPKELARKKKKASRRRKGRRGSAARDAEDALQDELAADLLQVLGPAGELTAPCDSSDSDYSSDYTSSTASGCSDPAPSADPFSQPESLRNSGHGSDSTSPPSTDPEDLRAEAEAAAKAASAEAEAASAEEAMQQKRLEAKAFAAVLHIQAAHRRHLGLQQGVRQLARRSCQDFLAAGAAGAAAAAAVAAMPERLHLAALLVQSVCGRYRAQAFVLQAAAAEALEALRRQQAAAAEAAMAQAECEAALAIQSVARQLQASRELLRLDSASRALLWQCAARRFLSAARLRQLEAEDRNAAAVRLQVVYRGRAARNELSRRRALRDGLLHLSPKSQQAVRLFQRCGRRFLAQAAIRQAELHEWRCANTIQAVWRGRTSRQAHAAEFAAWRKLRGDAASRLQGGWKMRAARRELQEHTQLRHAAAQWIQTAWRRTLAMRLTAAARLRHRQQRAAAVLQRTWRGYAVRKRVRPKLRARQAAAVRLQGLLQLRRSRLEARQLRQEVALRKAAAATRLQSSWRGRAVRREAAPQFARRLQAALIVQGLVKVRRARRQARELRRQRAAVRLQSAVRGMLGRLRALAERERRAAVRIQCLWRRTQAKAEAMRRRVQEVNSLLQSLTTGIVDGSETAKRPARGAEWLERVTAALEWKEAMEYEEEEKELRLRRAQEAARPELSAPLPGGDSKQSEQQPVRMAAAVTTDRALAAAAVARVRMRLRLRALLQTQAGGADGSAAPSFAPATAKALSVDDSVVSRLSPADAVAEVADVLQTSWAISAACRSAMPEGGAPPALEVLKLGLGSLKRKLQAELVRAGKSSPSEDAAALAALAAQDSAAASEAVARATTIKQAVLRPVQEELAAACAESRQALGALVAATAKVRPEVEALRETHKEQTAQAVENLRTEREAKHAQTVALHKIAIGTQIEKERLEAALMYKEKPKMVTFRRVLACVKELSHTLKDLEVNGTANRKSQGILQHTLRALEGRAAKAESDGRGKLLFGQEEEEDKDFAPSLQVLKKQDRQVEQEEQFREALRCEIASLRADLEAKSTHEAAACGAQLRKEAEAIGEAAAEAHRRLAAWRVQASALRPWLAQVVPIAKSGACLAAAAAYVKTSMTPAALRAALARLAPLELLAEQAANATDASSPREDELPDLLGKLSASRKVLAELKAAFPNVAMPVQHQPAAEQPKSEDEDDEGAADREAVSAAARPSVATSKGTMRKPKPALKAPLPSIQVPSPPPFPSPPASSGRNHSATPSPGETPTDTPREDGSPLARTAPLPRPPPRPAPGAAAQGFCLNSATAGLAELGNELSALSSALSSGPPKAGPPSKALRPSSAAGARAPAPASSAPSAKPQRSAAVNARPNSSAGSRPAAAVAQAASVSMTALGGQGSALRAVQKARVPVSTSWD